MTPLGLLSPGEAGEITEIKIHDHSLCCRCRETATDCGDFCSCGGAPHKVRESVRMEDMGLRVGKSVEMLSNSSGPILLRVDESRIAVARGIAMKIMVRRMQ
ncbi:MAG: ferrous iron transport protein A [Deltaproteobacteria bacterium]|nr:ferrous iron transport protein A [Deltaproteobacteria bacterium]